MSSLLRDKSINLGALVKLEYSTYSIFTRLITRLDLFETICLKKKIPVALCHIHLTFDQNIYKLIKICIK